MTLFGKVPCQSADDVACIISKPKLVAKRVITAGIKDGPLAGYCATGMQGTGEFSSLCCNPRCKICGEVGCARGVGPGYCCKGGIVNRRRANKLGRGAEVCRDESDHACVLDTASISRMRILRECTTKVITWGLYARNCEEVDAAAAACIGCGGPSTPGVALIDDVGKGVGAVYDGWRCKRVEYTFQAAQLLPPEQRGKWPPGNPPEPSDRRFWPRTKALFRLMIAATPNAALFVKIDADSLLNIERLRYIALCPDVSASPQPQPHQAATPPDYLGRSLKLFRFEGRELTYMQGGAYVLSHRAAMSLLTCTLGWFTKCPNQAFADLHNAYVNKMMRGSCWRRETIAEDLYVGVCMQRANVTPTGDPCFGTLGGGKFWAREHKNLTTNNNNLAVSKAAQLEAAIKDRDFHLERMKGHGCLCPISMHPLKGLDLLMWGRNQSNRLCASAYRGKAGGYRWGVFKKANRNAIAAAVTSPEPTITKQRGKARGRGGRGRGRGRGRGSAPKARAAAAVATPQPFAAQRAAGSTLDDLQKELSALGL